MLDNPNLRDGRDRAWVSHQPHELQTAAIEWLGRVRLPPTQEHIRKVVSYISFFPPSLKSQGRIPRQMLYDWLTRVWRN